MSERVTRRLRDAVHQQAENCCEYCQSQIRFSMASFSVEHIFPKSKGGKTILDNLALSCQGCNSSKYTKTQATDPVSKVVVTLYNPRQQSWRDHFFWNADYTRIVGKTPTGRATVEALELNHSGVVNLRRVLYAMNEHPPKSSLPADKFPS